MREEHGGIQRPRRVNDGAVTPPEAHLRNAHMNGTKPEIAQMSKRTHASWDGWLMTDGERHNGTLTTHTHTKIENTTDYVKQKTNRSEGNFC